MKKKLYVGCSLRHAPPEFIASVERLRDGLERDFDVLKFLGTDADTPEKIFKHDVGCVRSADLMLAVCDLPSIGLGIELGIAHELGIPTLAVARIDTRVSNMVLGMNHPLFRFARYERMEEIPELLRQVL